MIIGAEILGNSGSGPAYGLNETEEHIISEILVRGDRFPFLENSCEEPLDNGS